MSRKRGLQSRHFTEKHIMPSITLKTMLHIIYVAMIAFCLLSQIGCSSDSETDTPKAVNYVESGWGSYQSGDYAQALLSFERALNFDEALADAHNGVGWSHLSLSLNPALAQEAFQNAVQLDASNADAWVGLANVLYLRNKDANDFRSAARAIDNALQGDTQFLFRHDYRSKADLYALKASCYYYLGEVESARQETDKALQIDAANRTALVLQSLIKQ